MNWRTKAQLGRALDRLPGGRVVHRLMQRHVLKSLPLPEQEFRDRCRIAEEHLACVERALPGRPLSSLSFFEFGSGWDLTIPQLFWMHGVERQTTIDLNRLCRLEFVQDARDRLTRWAQAQPGGRAATRALVPLAGTLERYLGDLGITYVAPGDAASTALASGSVDVVTSSLVLEHVPPAVITAIYREMFRILKPGGVIIGSIDMSDHFSHSDKSISPWNFLTLTPSEWGRVNSDLLYQNRLRGVDHVALLEKQGFVIESTDFRIVPSPVAYEQVAVTLAAEFRARARAELEPTQVQVVARRPANTASQLPPDPSPMA